MSEIVERAIEQIRPIMDDLVEDYTFTDSAIERVVRGVIAAMRGPTEGMCEAGQKVNNICDEPGHFEFLARDEMTEAWQAMVDAALK